MWILRYKMTNILPALSASRLRSLNVKLSRTKRDKIIAKRRDLVTVILLETGMKSYSHLDKYAISSSNLSVIESVSSQTPTLAYNFVLTLPNNYSRFILLWFSRRKKSHKITEVAAITEVIFPPLFARLLRTIQLNCCFTNHRINDI